MIPNSQAGARVDDESESAVVGRKHMPQLDGLRAVAVTLVFLHHWTAVGRGLGAIGVQLFFVLSGFLITGILLEQRATVDQGGQSWAFSLRQFYARRFLRIFPLYYFCLTLFFVLNAFGIRETAIWHLTYLSNVFFFRQGQFSGMFSHFWSLAVEEQFYLIWPFVVLFTPRRSLGLLIVFLIATAPATRALLFAQGFTSYAAYNTLLPAKLDTLGLGALAAWRWQSGTQSARDIIPIPMWLLAACMAGVVLARFNSEGFAVAVFDQFAIGIVSVTLVVYGARGFQGFFGRLLQHPVLVYLGAISYGLYVWHMFAPAFVRNIIRVAGLPHQWNKGPIGFVMLFAWTVAAASLTWFFLERPINRLKRLFPYRNGRAHGNSREGYAVAAQDRSPTTGSVS